MRTRLLPLFAFALLASPLIGQDEAAVEPPAPAPVLAPVEPAPAAPEVSIKEDAPAPVATKSTGASGLDTLSVDFPDEEVRTILRNVADLFELNLIIPETLQGRSSIKLRDVTWRQIFQSVLAPIGYTYIEEGNIIKVVSNESLAQEPTTTEVFLINYARAADIKPTLDSLITTPGGKIMVDARSNSLIITEAPSRMNRIRPIIEQLDRATDQVMIETKFVEVTDSDVKNIGVNWSSLSGYGVNVGGGGENGSFGGYSRTRGQDGSTGSSGSTTTGTTGSNVSTGVQGTGATTSTTVTSTNGNVTNVSTTGTTGSISNTTTNTNGSTSSDSLNLLNSLTNTGTTSRVLSAVFSADQFGVVLSALQTLNNTKVVSNPTVVTLNNSEATINVGEERPIPNYAFNEQTGTFQISGFIYKPIGVILKVTPQVNAQGFIKLTVSPEVSQATSSISFGGASATQIPIISTRKATTQVSLKDGYTMAIGGLLTQNAINGESKVPVLGSIPGLGRLFRSNTKDTTTKNLIIFITAKSISSDGAPVEEVFSSESVRLLKMRREELPGHRDGTDPFLKDPPPDAKDAKKSAKKNKKKAE